MERAGAMGVLSQCSWMRRSCRSPRTVLHRHSGTALRGLLLRRLRRAGDNDLREVLQGEFGISQEAEGGREIFADASGGYPPESGHTPPGEERGRVENLIKQLCANGEHRVSRAKGAPNRGMLSRQFSTVLGVCVGKLKAPNSTVFHTCAPLFGDLDQFRLRL